MMISKGMLVIYKSHNEKGEKRWITEQKEERLRELIF